ncbi:MAG: aminodeoxychorismate lyase [Methyloprofundus sp.]|nr:aminodeoxychorismate lyase [Methyloprofundus sp.]
MILINGKQATTIEATDRGLHYGDGLFETIEITNQQPVFLTQHLQRLEAGCFVLKIPFPNKTLLIDEVMQLCKNTTHGVIKIMLTRGSGGRGYRQPEAISTTRYIALHPYPKYPESYKTKGIAARFCDMRLALNPTLAGIKHNNRLEQVLARAEWQDEFQEGLMLNLNDEVVEGTMTNLFVVKNGILLTPKLDQSGIKGIIRQIIIDLCLAHEIPLQQQIMTKEFVLAADEVFVTNSVIGIWPITQLQDSSYKVGDLTQRLINYYHIFKLKGAG